MRTMIHNIICMQLLLCYVQSLPVIPRIINLLKMRWQSAPPGKYFETKGKMVVINQQKLEKKEKNTHVYNLQLLMRTCLKTMPI